MRHDRFADRQHCSLASPRDRVVYQPHAVGYRFAKRRDTLDAWYRVDGGAPRRWQDRYPALIAAGAQIDGPGLDDPTGGTVWIPVDEVRDARIVTIRLAASARLRAFRMRGFTSMLDAARRLGCASDADFTI